MSTLQPAPAPQNLDAEEAVLGAMMLSRRAIEAVSEVLSATDFYRQSHGKIYRAALGLYARSEPIDAITLADELQERAELEDVGGRVRINELANLVPAASNAAHYARIVHEMATLRGLILVGQEIARLGMEREGDADDLLDRAAKAVSDLIERRATPRADAHQQGAIDGASFAFDEPEDAAVVWGAGEDVLWARGEPLLLVGAIGVGKTTILQQLALARSAIRPGGLLGFPVVADKRPVVYLALDRPRQAARSLRRMVGEHDREALRERLVVWRGHLAFDPIAEPDHLAAWVEREFGAGT